MFPGSVYLTAVGSGDSRHSAERNALGWLVSRFGMDIDVDERTKELYWEMIGSGTAKSWSHSVDVATYFEKKSSIDNLIGVQIGDFYDTSRGTVYALAVLDREKAISMYREIVMANEEVIGNLTRMSADYGNTFEGYDLVRRALVFADMNASYAPVLSVLGSPMQGLRRGDALRREAAELRRAITIGINVSGDRNGMIRATFAKALTNLGLRISSANPSYVLDVQINVTLEERFSEHFNRNITWAHKTLLSELKDTRTGRFCFPIA